MVEGTGKPKKRELECRCGVKVVTLDPLKRLCPGCGKELVVK